MWKEWVCEIEKRTISADELCGAEKAGNLEGVWRIAKAAVIPPVGHLREGDQDMKIKDGGIGELSQKLYDTITGIPLGKIKGPEGWSVEV